MDAAEAGAALPDVRGTVSGYDWQSNDVSALSHVFVCSVGEK